MNFNEMRVNMKKTILPILTLAASLVCGSAAAVDEGDIWQIFPCDRYGQDVDRSSITSDDTVPAGSNIYFKVRLISKGNDYTPYHIAGTGATSTNTSINPPRICLYVSGQPTFADYIGEIEYGSHFTDVIFCYTPKAGDFAMPVKLGTKDGPASDLYTSEPRYFFDPLTSWMWEWASTDKATKTEKAVANWWFFNGDPATRDETGRTKGMDTSLAECHYYIKTVDFDSEWESETVWRSVHQGSETIKVGSTPSLVASSAIAEQKTFYVWSDDEDIVKVTGPNMTVREVRSGMWRNVAAVVIDGGQDSAKFEIYGVGEFKQTKLIMSAYPKYNVSDATGAVETDYVIVPVACVEKLPPTIKITPEQTKVIAASDYTYYVTELNVRFTQAYDKDVTLTITPSLEASALLDWKDYIAIYDEKTLDISVEAATNTLYTIPAGSLVPMENGAQKRIYLFALRGDENTINTKHLQFTASTENLQAHHDITGWDTPTGLININPAEPEITEPVEGDNTLTAVAGADRTLRIKVDSMYADQNVVSNGYQIFIIKNSDTETSFETVGGDTARYVPGQGGYLYLTNAAGKASDKLPTVQYSVTDPALNKSTLKVKSSISGLESDERHFSVTVSAPAGYTVNVIDDAGVVVQVPKYNEGEGGTIRIQLDRANDTGASLYAFLKPANEDAKAAIQCGFLAADDNYGLEIQKFSTATADSFVMIDGRGASNSSFKYTVELRTAPLYQDGVPVTSYQCKNTLVITSLNVIPTIEKVYLGLDETQLVDGKWIFPDLVIAKGVKQTFTAGVLEPGVTDLNATGTQAFKTRWRFSTTGVGTKPPDNADDKTNGVIFGDPETKKAEFAFTKAGTWKVIVDCQDKDMSTFGNGELKQTFTFYVEVVDQPAITVSAHYLSGTSLSEEVDGFNETESTDMDGNACINVALGFNKCDFPLVVQLTVTDPGTVNPGQFVLQTSSNVQNMGNGIYYVTFAPGETSVVIPVKTLDGTKLSKAPGFQLSTKMLTDEPCPETGDPAQSTKDYYVGSSKYIKVANVDPQVDEFVDIDPRPMTTNMTSVGEANVISWDITDVAGDFVNDTKGIVVTVKCEGSTLYTETVTDPANASGSCEIKFVESGVKFVTLSFQDKDGKAVKFELIYDVAASKTLALIPHGPLNGSSGLYKNGYGEGRVYAEKLSGAKSSAATTAWKHIFNCGLDKAWYLYGYGYKVGDVEGSSFHYPYTTAEGEKTGYNDERNIPIDETGKGAASGGYKYSNIGENVDAYGNPADSFLYAWVKKSTEEKATEGTYSVLAYKPEAPYVKDGGTEVTLPTEQLDDGSYDITTVEGVFSLEYLWTDNMGDINSDGIPDAWFHNLAFTESTEVVNVATGVSGTEETAIDDTTSVAAYNTDEDFLPELTLNGQAYLLDYTANRKFTAKLELRGYGEHLNDAPNNNVYTRLTGFKPERFYGDPDVYGPTSTLSKVEFLAWQEYAAANSLDVDDPKSWEKWSPENPTDPTKADTDDDGIDDGFEYAFWYRAHVGFYDEKTQMHTYLTGRRFDPKNPGEGTFISSAEIEKVFNPTVPFDESATTLDSDNDGLPDLVEFALGSNPFDFDTDGDGVPDGYEVLVAGTDPCKAATAGVPDGDRNYDGDHMAWTTVYHVGGDVKDAQDNDCDEYLLASDEGRPVDTIVYYTTFAVAAENGDTDGVQWYAVRESTEVKTEVSEDPVGKVLLFSYYKGTGDVADEKNWVKAATTRASIPVVKLDMFGGKTGLVRLAGDLTKAEAFCYEEVEVEGEDPKLVHGSPIRLPCGTVLSYDDAQEASDYYEMMLAEDIKVDICNAAWPYGNETKSVLKVDDGAAQQVLALGRALAAKKGARIVAAPLATRPVALLHYYVYQAFGFDPRTAWNSTTPLAPRWGKVVTTGGESEVVEGKSNLAGLAARTRPYTTRDECLVMSFLLNAGCVTEADLVATTKTPWADLFLAYTTNPRGPGETTVRAVKPEETDEDTTTDTDTDTTDKNEPAEAVAGDNGADTDEDGVPDGWELYVMGGEGVDGQFSVVSISSSVDGDVDANLSPWIASAKLMAKTDIEQDGDNLTQWQEYAGTDSVAAYTNVSATITRPEEHAKWINKFFPTDPWNSDTDGDGLSDSAEFSSTGVFNAKAFIYGTPEDDSKLACIPGGGLNPCSVDTDRDGLPDAWEAQFAGSTVYDGEFNEKLATGNTKSGNPEWGLVDGMDGTVADAYTMPNHKEIEQSFESADGLTNTVNRLVSPNRDYDHDGLENWQEYLVGAMRCWRYDDPYTRWDALPGNVYTNENGVLDIEKVCAAFGFADENEFWYRTLADKTSPYYNPRFVFDTNPAAVYWSRVTNAWDVAYNTADGGSYYIFYHRSGADHLKDLWGKGMGLDTTPYNQFPQRYACCSPIEADTDQDGMDDYYELFHGLNPLLGLSGVSRVDKGPYDVIYDVWYKETVGSPHSAEQNWWTEKKTIRVPQGAMDFVAYPFLAGSATADPDGDDIRNQEEALMPENATATWHHTDPTPLWMTDSSYSNSLVRLFGQMPANPMMMSAPEGSFTSIVEEGSEDDPVTYYFRDFDAYTCMDTDMGPMRFFAPSRPDHWCASEYMKPSWLFSFEENEGYDTDHDGISDYEELEGKFRTASDPIDADSPKRRQAMYFQGASRPSLLMTMPQVKEKSPRLDEEYSDDPSFLQYTVECWAYPETSDDATVVERAVWAAPSSLADQELLRCNFQIAIKEGKWYTKFDSRGTLRDSKVEAFSREAIDVKAWTHLAATYDGKTLTFYVNGQSEASIISGLQPEYGVSALALKANRTYAFDREYPLHAIIVGASAKTQAEGAADGTHLNVLQNAAGLTCYTRWFKGYIDEIRIWDGARSAKQIENSMSTRFTAEMAKENRSTFYEQWSTVDLTYPHGRRRYAKDWEGKDCEVEPELRYHYCFDSVVAAENEKMVMREPHGFGGNGVKASVSRPDGYTITWWSDVLASYADTVYNSPSWVMWVPNTVTHLPRFDGSTLDSYYWSEDFKGDVKGTYKFARTAEPVSLWTQMSVQRVLLTSSSADSETYKSSDMAYRTAGTRHHLVNSMPGYARFLNQFDFTGRHLNQSGDDLLPLGGAYVKYCDQTVGLWDGQGASTNWEITGNDADNDGLPDWWETYADENYRIGDKPFESLDWNTLINYHGNIMKAGEAYLRDLAKGFYANSYGEVVEGPTKFRQTYDENKNGIPDWWEDFYRLTDENPLADSDNDGLPNYLEYMLSEVFDLGKLFNPTVANSVDKHLPDYFFRLGSLYVGEVFTDHDLVDDLWEDRFNEYPAKYASRLKYDALQDPDEDGWSNRAECRADHWGTGIFPDIIDTFVGGSIDSQLRCFPQPAIGLTVSYVGHRDPAWNKIVVRTWTGTKNRHDARFVVNSLKTADNGDIGGMEKTQVLGSYRDKAVIRGYLNPGLIVPSSVKIQKAKISSELTYFWHCTECPRGVGSYADYKADIDVHGEAKADPNGQGVTLDKTSLSWDTFLSSGGGSDGQHGEFYYQDGDDTDTKGTKVVGEIDYRTGEYSIDVGTLIKEYGCDFEGMAFKASFAYALGAYWPQTVWLSYPDQGYVREGKNTIEAFFDLNDDDEWQPGEPYGIVRDVDVSWGSNTAEIELKDVSPVMPRIDLVGDTADRTLTRDGLYKSMVEAVYAEYGDQPLMISNMLKRLEWQQNNVIVDATLNASQAEPVRVRVVRWLVNDIPVYSAGAAMRVVYDNKISTTEKTSLTEADLLSDAVLDLDWEYLRAEVIDNASVRAACGAQVTNVTYLVVVGDGPAEWHTTTAVAYEVSALQTLIRRNYSATRTVPNALSPGDDNQVVVDASPTFRWSIAGDDLTGYTAFKVQVKNASGEMVYDSGVQPMPSRLCDNEGNLSYEWTPALYVGDKTTLGKVFENNADYTWRVSAYNAKFTSDAFSTARSFHMNVQTNGYLKGKANVAVKYFGPKKVWARGETVRVQAFTSPDFTGRPVAAGYVANPDDSETGLNVTGKVVRANSTVIGLPSGRYYLKAFVDSNGNGVCDEWESQGYSCQRDGTTVDALEPMAIAFDTEVGAGDLVTIFLEDADTDMDGLPDAWEYAMYGNLTTKGVELLSTTPAGETVVNMDLTGTLTANGDVAGGLAAMALTALRNAGTLALALDADVSSSDSFNDALSGLLSEDLVKEGVKIERLEMVDGKIVIAVSAATGVSTARASAFGSVLATEGRTFAAVCDVYRKADLSDEAWTLVKTATITAGAAEASEITLDVPVAEGGFYKVEVHK